MRPPWAATAGPVALVHTARGALNCNAQCGAVHCAVRCTAERSAVSGALCGCRGAEPDCLSGSKLTMPICLLRSDMAASIEPAATCSAAKDEALHQRCGGIPCDAVAACSAASDEASRHAP